MWWTVVHSVKIHYTVEGCTILCSDVMYCAVKSITILHFLTIYYGVLQFKRKYWFLDPKHENRPEVQILHCKLLKIRFTLQWWYEACKCLLLYLPFIHSSSLPLLSPLLFISSLPLSLPSKPPMGDVHILGMLMGCGMNFMVTLFIGMVCSLTLVLSFVFIIS